MNIYKKIKMIYRLIKIYGLGPLLLRQVERRDVAIASFRFYSLKVIPLINLSIIIISST